MKAIGLDHHIRLPAGSCHITMGNGFTRATGRESAAGSRMIIAPTNVGIAISMDMIENITGNGVESRLSLGKSSTPNAFSWYSRV